MGFLFPCVCTARDNFVEQQSGARPEASSQGRETCWTIGQGVHDSRCVWEGGTAAQALPARALPSVAELVLSAAKINTKVKQTGVC